MASISGGAIDLFNANGILSDCNFINNTVKMGGGAIYWQGINGHLVNSNFY